MSEISPSENRYMELMRGLDTFSRDSFDVEVVDHDFAPDHEPTQQPPQSLEGYRRELDRLYGDITDDTAGARFMRRNIESADIALQAVAGRLPEELSSFPDYVEQVMGVRPEMATEEEISEHSKATAQAVSRLGYDYEAEQREAFHSNFAIKSEEMTGKVMELAGVSRDDLVKAVGQEALVGVEEPYIEVVEDKYTWQGYFGTDENKQFMIKMNANPLLKISETEERVALVHERAHGLSSATSKARILAGELSPVIGIVPCFSPVYFQEEVIARSVENHMLYNQSDPRADFVLKSNRYSNIVAHNMILMANDGFAEDEVTAYGQNHLPFEDPEKVKNSAEMFARKLVYKTVFSIDTEAIRLGQTIGSLPGGERESLIINLCEKPADPYTLIDSSATDKL